MSHFIYREGGVLKSMDIEDLTPETKYYIMERPMAIHDPRVREHTVHPKVYLAFNVTDQILDNGTDLFEGSFWAKSGSEDMLRQALQIELERNPHQVFAVFEMVGLAKTGAPRVIYTSQR